MIAVKNGSFFKLNESNEHGAMVSDLLIPGEIILNVFKAMRDGVVFTDKRAIAVSVAP